MTSFCMQIFMSLTKTKTLLLIYHSQLISPQFYNIYSYLQAILSLILCILHNYNNSNQMDQTSPKYNFRRRDYAKIKSWYDFAQASYMPEEEIIQLNQPTRQKINDWHYRFMFSNLELSEYYVNSNMKNLFQIKQLAFMNSLYHRQKDCIVYSGKQTIVECQFDVTNLSIKCNEELVFYFYLTQASPKEFQFCLQIQILNNDGQMFKFGSSKFPLLQRKDSSKQNVMLVFNNNFMDKKVKQQLQTISQIKGSKKQQFQTADLFVAKIAFELDTQQIKQMKKYLPSCRIINKNSKLPPTNFNLKKKKQQISSEASYKINLHDLMIQIADSSLLKSHLINNNPFTFSHKELVSLQMKQYKVMIDQHNGWKLLQNRKKFLQLQLVLQKGQKTYLSSKKIAKFQINYYDSDLLILFAALICRVEFKLQGMVQQKKEQQFFISWLPLPLDLSLKQNKIQLLMVNDLAFPLKFNHLFNIPTFLSATFVHPNFQNYKSKAEDKLYRQRLLDQTNILSSNKYMKLKSRKMDTLSSQGNKNESIQAYIQNARQFVRNKQCQAKKEDYVKVTGRCDNSQSFPAHHSTLPMEQTVGKVICSQKKVLKVKLQIDTFIPEADASFDYYLPRNLEGSIYFLRQNHTFNINITEQQAKFDIPLQISNQKIKIYFKKYINSVEDFEAIISSRFIIILYEPKCYRYYAKGIATAQQILGAAESSKVAYLDLKRWEQNSQKTCGKFLVLVEVQVQKFRQNNSKIEQLDVQRVMSKLSTEQRMRMRIGNFKGDFFAKTETVNLLKKKQHNEFIQKVVASEEKCDGQLSYEIGMDAYHLLTFTNEDKSDNNVFTFHLNCPYAQIITNQAEFRSVIQTYNFQPCNFQRLAFYLKEPAYQSYYQSKILFSKEIGILIKLNVFQQNQKEQPLRKIELTIKRNTIQTKKLLVKCKFKSPLYWDIFYDSALYNNDLQENASQTIVSFDEQLLQKYTDLQVMTKHVKLSVKDKKMIINKVTKQMSIMIMARGKEMQQKKVFILYRIIFFQGQKLTLLTGKPYGLHIQLQNKEQAQILRCNDNQLQIKNYIKFYNPIYNQSQDIEIQILKPCTNKNFVIVCLDLSGNQLSQYLLKIESKVQFISNKIEIILEQSSTYAVTVQNPYACACYFDILCSSGAVILQETEVKMQSYGQRLIQFRVKGRKQRLIYFYLLDKRDNICQITEATCRAIQTNFKKDQPQNK